MSSVHTADVNEHIKKHVQVYILVFVALMVLTVVTVAVSYLHLSIGKAIAVALFIATIKGSLVALYFMHLISEKKVIYAVLILAVLFILGLPVLTKLAYEDVPRVKEREQAQP